MAPRELNFITGNANKLAEVTAILKGVIDLKNETLDLPEIQGTIEEISKAKCKTAAEIVRMRSQVSSNFNCTTKYSPDWRSSLDRGYMPLFHCNGRIARTLHV